MRSKTVKPVNSLPQSSKFNKSPNQPEVRLRILQGKKSSNHHIELEARSSKPEVGVELSDPNQQITQLTNHQITKGPEGPSQSFS